MVPSICSLLVVVGPLVELFHFRVIHIQITCWSSKTTEMAKKYLSGQNIFLKHLEPSNYIQSQHGYMCTRQYVHYSYMCTIWASAKFWREIWCSRQNCDSECSLHICRDHNTSTTIVTIAQPLSLRDRKSTTTVAITSPQPLSRSLSRPLSLCDRYQDHVASSQPHNHVASSRSSLQPHRKTHTKSQLLLMK
jgi:hypothetical protein